MAGGGEPPEHEPEADLCIDYVGGGNGGKGAAGQELDVEHGQQQHWRAEVGEGFQLNLNCSLQIYLGEEKPRIRLSLAQFQIAGTVLGNIILLGSVQVLHKRFSQTKFGGVRSMHGREAFQIENTADRNTENNVSTNHRWAFKLLK